MRYLFLGLCLGLALGGCTQPTANPPSEPSTAPLETGREVDPPAGCKALRERGGTC